MLDDDELRSAVMLSCSPLCTWHSPSGTVVNEIRGNFDVLFRLFSPRWLLPNDIVDESFEFFFRNFTSKFYWNSFLLPWHYSILEFVSMMEDLDLNFISPG